MTIKSALASAIKKLKQKAISSAHLDAEILLASVLKQPREWLLAHDDRELTAGQLIKFKALISRRAKYEPLAYIIGYKEFYGLKIKVNNNVLIPRPETELLVDEVIKAYNQTASTKPKIIDIGTGSGAIALALKKTLPKAQIWALETSSKALSLARQNAKNLHLSIDWLKSDLLATLPVKSLGGAILAVNLPYVAKSEPAKFSKEVRLGLRHEPASAIFANQDGTADYHKLFEQVSHLPVKPTYLIAEIGSTHYKKFLKLANTYFVQSKIELKIDLAGRPRLLIIKF